jgi:hypothetical protein
MTDFNDQEREALEEETGYLEAEHAKLPTDERYGIAPGSQHRSMELKRRIASLHAALAAREDTERPEEVAR